MKDISLKDLLEAGCHFGHKVDRWHPKAASFIYGEREGIHIIDLAKTRDGLKAAALAAKNLGLEGKILLFVATKRQAKGVVTEAAKRVGVAYLTNRWIGGFMTNWDEVKKNVEKMNRFRKEKEDGSWKKFPKHEMVQLEKYLRRLEMVYQGVAGLTNRPDALYIVDIKKEIACLRESLQLRFPIIAITDTNTDPTQVDYPVPANDDAVGSIQFITNYIADAYLEGKQVREKKEGKEKVEEVKKVEKAEEAEKAESIKKEEKIEKVAEKEKVEKVEKIEKKEKAEKKVEKVEPEKKKRGKPKKTV